MTPKRYNETKVEHTPTKPKANIGLKLYSTFKIFPFTFIGEFTRFEVGMSWRFCLGAERFVLFID